MGPAKGHKNKRSPLTPKTVGLKVTFRPQSRHMKNLRSCFLLFTIPIAVHAQKPVINHVALSVQNLQKSAAFYQDLIGLDSIPEPFRDGRHAWFSIGPKSHLHLIQDAPGPFNHPKNHHLCFSVPSVETFVANLHKAAIPYEDVAGKSQTVQVRVDGVKQIYFKDPDGYWIEINDARE
jgi:lactoylglutathione lyase